MSNPFNEERQEQLKTDAQEFLTVFGKEYLKSFGLCMFEKIKAEIDGEEADERRLNYRDWNSCERPSMFSGYTYMKTGEGAGAWGSWKKVFMVERQDYNIDYYKSDKDYEKKPDKPKGTIKTCGYSLERDPTYHYKCDMRSLGAGLGLTEEEVTVLSKCSPFAWSLSHFNRTNYLFQLHKGKDPFCPCFGGNIVEPEDVGAENEKERETWLDFMDRCVSNCSARNTDDVKGAAFQKCALEKMPEHLGPLYGFSDNGTAAEILVDAMMIHCLNPMRDGILGDLQGPVSIRIMGWYKTRGVIQKTLQTLLDPAYQQAEKAAGTVGDKIEPVIKAGVGPILQIKNKVMDKVKSGISDKIGGVLAQHVTPHLKPIFTAFDKPLDDGFTKCKEVYSKHVNIGQLPDDPKKMRQVLDSIPRNWDNVWDARQASYAVVEPLRQLKDVSSEIFGEIDVYDLRAQIEQVLLESLDGAIYTTILKIEADGKGAGDAIKDDILAAFDHDATIARNAFMRHVIQTLLVSNFKKALSPVTEPVISGITDLIPDDMQDFLNVEGIYDEIVEVFVGEPIGQMVDAAYPKPSSGQKVIEVKITESNMA